MVSLYSGYSLFNRRWWVEVLNPFTYWRWIKWFCQRGYRGWADCDVWSVDGYLCDIMVPMLEHLKKTKQGYPCPDDAIIDENGNSTEEEYNRWQMVWDQTLDDMIEGFRAANRVLDGPPDRFYTMRSIEEQSKEPEFVKESDGNYRWNNPVKSVDSEGIKRWSEEQEHLRLKGFAAFTKWFYSLWD